jgi:hypothetical protein
MSVQRPDRNDVLIRQTPSRHFAVGLYSSPPQIDCVTFEDALFRAGRFASKARVQLWYAAAEGSVRHLADMHSLKRLLDGYNEFPTLRLTLAQARRLMTVDADTCRGVLDTLIDLGILARTSDGSYVSAACSLAS